MNPKQQKRKVLVVIELAVLAQFYKNFAKTEPTLTTFHRMVIIFMETYI